MSSENQTMQYNLLGSLGEKGAEYKGPILNIDCSANQVQIQFEIDEKGLMKLGTTCGVGGPKSGMGFSQ